MSQWACSSCGKELPPGDSTGTVSSVCPSCGGKLVRMEKVNLSAVPGSSPPEEGGEYDVTRKLAAKSAMKGAQPADPDSPTKTSDLDRGADGRQAGAKPAAEAAGAADPEADPLVGRILGGCEILSVVGRGAMGTVYEAKQLSLDRTVAVKTIRRDYVTDKQFLQRFRQEARTVGRFNTPYVVQIHEVGFDQGYHYLVMELVRGGNLRSYVASQRERALSTTDALQFLSQAAEGLLQAEKLKIIHRDIKPGNLLVDPNGRLKITDFGIAKMLESDTQITMTGTNDVIGTPLYMSPEQVEGGPIDHRSDMYSLGATFFHLLTGTPPVEGDSFYEVIKRKSLLPSLSPRRMLKESRVPAEVSTVIEKMTALRAADRYPSFQDLLDDIARVREGRKIEPPAQVAQGAKKPVPLGRSKRTLVSASLVVAILAVVGYSFIPRSDPDPGAGKVVEKKPEEKASSTTAGGTAVVSAGSTGSAGEGQTPAATRGGNGGGTGEKGGPPVVMPVTVGTGSGGGEGSGTKVEPAREDQRLGATLENLKARFVNEGPVKTVLDDATAFRAQVGGMAESELQAQAKSFLDDIDECRSIGDSLRSRPVDAVDVTPPFEAVARHWSSVNPVLQPPPKAGPELKLWIQSERSKRLEALEKKVIPALQALIADAEKAKKSYLEWEITPEAYREAMDRVMASKARLMEALPEKKDVWDAAITGAVITSLQDISSRTEVDRSIKELETSATKLLSEITASKSGSDWKPELAERVGKEAEAIGSALKDIQAKHPKALVTPAVSIWKEIDERRGKWAAHMKAMEEAIAALQPGKLDGAAEKIQALEATGISDPAAEKLRAGRQAILDGFQILLARLDTIAAGAQFAAAEEKLRDFPAAAQYAAKLRERVDLFREKSSSMAPVQAGDVDPPDRKPLTRVDAFFIDRTEVSVREFEQFEAAMARAKYEDVRRLWPTEAIFSKFRTLPEYLRRGDIDRSWPIEEVNYYQARAYALWREKDILTLEEWWLAARGPIRGGTVRITAPNTIESRNPERPVRVDQGGVAVAFPTTYRVHHLSGNVAEWCKVDAGAITAPLVGGRYADSTAKKLQGEVPDNSPLGDSRRGYGFRCVLRPADFFEGLLPAPPKKPGAP